MSDNETPPIVVPATATIDMATSALRTVIFALSAGGAIVGFLRTDDLVGLINYLKSSEFTAGFLALVGVATFVWGQWKTRHRGNQLAAVAANPKVPDEVITTSK